MTEHTYLRYLSTATLEAIEAPAVRAVAEAVGRLNEALAAEYIRQSGKTTHANTCSTSVAPAMRPGPCDCDASDFDHMPRNCS